MKGGTQFKEPADCSDSERQDFARLVREGFSGSDKGLLQRIGKARLLAFYYAADGSLAAVAGLKGPVERYRRDVFEKASVPESVADYDIELGWVYTVPSYRGKGIAEGLCRKLLALVPDAGVFATTRPSNDSMSRILLVLGFEQVGRPYRRRDEELVVFLRPRE